MNPLSLIPNLSEFAQKLPAKLSKDERRIRLFVADVAVTAGRVASTAPDQLDEFLLDAGALAATYANGFNPKKWSIGNIFGRDPLFQARQDVRAFAKRWKMSQTLIEELG